METYQWMLRNLLLQFVPWTFCHLGKIPHSNFWNPKCTTPLPPFMGVSTQVHQSGVHWVTLRVRSSCDHNGQQWKPISMWSRYIFRATHLSNYRFFNVHSLNSHNWLYFTYMTHSFVLSFLEVRRREVQSKALSLHLGKLLETCINRTLSKSTEITVREVLSIL